MTVDPNNTSPIIADYGFPQAVKFHPLIPQSIRNVTRGFFNTHKFRIDPFNKDNPIDTLAKTLRNNGYGLLISNDLMIAPLFVFADIELRSRHCDKSSLLKSFRDHGFSDEFIERHYPEILES